MDTRVYSHVHNNYFTQSNYTAADWSLLTSLWRHILAKASVLHLMTPGLPHYQLYATTHYDDLCQMADVEAWHRLHSASSPSLVVRRTRLSTYSDRAFPVAALRVWKSATPRQVCTVTACFPQSSEDPSLQTQFSLTIQLCPQSDTRHYGHVNHCFYLLTYQLRPTHSTKFSFSVAGPSCGIICPPICMIQL